MVGSIAILFVTLLQGAVPPLTQQQQTQLDTAQDYTASWDEGPLYPLMQNALQWETLDEAGAMIPDYEAVKAQPDEYRGRLFVIEGQLGGPPEQITKPMARPGPWDNRIQRWSVLIRTDPDEVAVVYLVNPPSIEKTPRASIRVRLLCRFYKVWRFKDLNDQPTDYLVFVGKTTREAAPNQMQRKYQSQELPLVKMLVLLFVAAAALVYIFRRGMGISVQPKPLRGQLARREAVAQRETNPQEDTDEPTDLPEDPVDALDELASRHKQESDHGER